METRNFGRVLLLAAITLFVMGTVVWVSSAADPIVVTSTPAWSLEPLIENIDFAEWYKAQTGYDANAITFGAYTALPLTDTLFVGFGTGAPVEFDGALLATTDGVTMTALGSPNEQGMHEMVWWQDALHIAGSDPCCGDGWEAGNHYMWQSDTGLVKYRDVINGLTNVIHVWDLESEGDVLYAATSDHIGDFSTRTGSIFSTTTGADWTRVGSLGGYRNYDLAAFNGTYYGLFTDVRGDPVSMATSSDLVTWTTVISKELNAVEMMPFFGRLLAIGYDEYELHLLDETPSKITLPFKLATSPNGYRGRFDTLEVVDDTLYALAEFDDGMNGVVRTRDLQSWEILTKTNEVMTMVTWWPAKNSLIIGTAGSEGGLFHLTDQRVYLPIVRNP